MLRQLSSCVFEWSHTHTHTDTGKVNSLAGQLLCKHQRSDGMASWACGYWGPLHHTGQAEGGYSLRGASRQARLLHWTHTLCQETAAWVRAEGGGSKPPLTLALPNKRRSGRHPEAAPPPSVGLRSSRGQQQQRSTHTPLLLAVCVVQAAVSVHEIRGGGHDWASRHGPLKSRGMGHMWACQVQNTVGNHKMGKAAACASLLACKAHWAPAKLMRLRHRGQWKASATLCSHSRIRSTTSRRSMSQHCMSASDFSVHEAHGMSKPAHAQILPKGSDASCVTHEYASQLGRLGW